MPIDDVPLPNNQPNITEPDSQMGDIDSQYSMNPDIETQNNNTMEDDSTMGIINQLSDDDKDAVRSYAESLLKKNDEKAKDDEEYMDDGLNMEAPTGGNMSESVIFTKAQVKKINENLSNLETDTKKPLPKKSKNIIDKKSPFNAPKFE